MEPEVIGAGEAVAELASPSQRPPWAECAQGAREDIRSLRERLGQLSKAQQRRLLRVFGDDRAPDKEVEAICSQITSLIRRCEQSVHHVRTRGADCVSNLKERQCRENVQRSLAAQLQQLSQEFRQAQKDYLGEIRSRQHTTFWDDDCPDQAQKDTGGGFDADLEGLSAIELQELDGIEFIAGQRSTEISQIASSINDLHTVFKELAVLVIDQGSILDRIDYNIEQVVAQSDEANKQLKKAEDSQKSYRALKCILLLVVIDIVLLVILMVKLRH